MKIDVLFALPGPENSVQGDKLLVVAAATEREDPRYLKGVLADVAEVALGMGAYRAVRRVTLELDEALVLALLNEDKPRLAAPVARANVDKGLINRRGRPSKPRWARAAGARDREAKTVLGKAADVCRCLDALPCSVPCSPFVL